MNEAKATYQDGAAEMKIQAIALLEQLKDRLFCGGIADVSPIYTLTLAIRALQGLSVPILGQAQETQVDPEPDPASEHILSRPRRNAVEVGMPALLYLEQFGVYVYDAFHHAPYLVGSALTSKNYRDVDVRLILPDEEYDALFDTAQTKLPERCNSRWTALCLAWSAFGEKLTGLPIDFQIQRSSWAASRYEKERSEFLGCYVGRVMKAHKEEAA